MKGAGDKGIIDLHIHSNFSDGQYTPNQLIRKAKQQGLKVIAITDHDTILGNQNITLPEKEKEGIQIISGIELSAKVLKGRMHILGYDLDLTNRNLNKTVATLKNNSVYSVLGMLNQIKIDYNIAFKTEDIKKIFAIQGNIGRPDIAKLCIQYGYTQGVQESFDKYLNPAYQRTRTTNKGILAEECIELIKGAGGIPVLAHPTTLLMSDEELRNTLKELTENGLKGIEVYHSDHSEEEVEKYLKLAEEFNLYVSGGSDFHGPKVKPNIGLGTGKNNNIKIKQLTILEQIKRT